MLRIAYGIAHRVVAVSPSQNAWMLDARLASERKLALIPPYQEHPVLRRLPPPAIVSPLRIGALGRLRKRNGFDQLLQAVRSLPAEHLELIIGGDGPEASALRQQAKGLPHVHFTGPVEDACAFLSTVDVLVVPLRYEALRVRGSRGPGSVAPGARGEYGRSSGTGIAGHRLGSRRRQRQRTHQGAAPPASCRDHRTDGR
ncbi:MAG: glycosyltransferase [Pseudomonadota bacterium]